MVKKHKRYAGKTEERRKDWGEVFGKRMERTGKGMGKDWWFRTFGLIGPLIGSIFGIVCLSIGIWLLNLVNAPLASTFISSLSHILLANLHWFFLIILFFGYNDYFSRIYFKKYWMVSPIVNSVRIIIVIWVLLWILSLVNSNIGSSLLVSVSNSIYANLLIIFLVFAVLGYVFLIIKKSIVGS